MSLFQSVVLKFLKGYISKYVQNFSKELFTISLHEVTAKSLELKQTTLDFFPSLQIVRGSIGFISAKFSVVMNPSHPVCIVISDLDLTISPSPESTNLDESDKMHTSFLEEEFSKLHFGRKKSDQDLSEISFSDSPMFSFVKKSLFKYLLNSQIRINNVRLRYEDISEPGFPISFTFTLDKLLLDTCNKDFEVIGSVEEFNYKRLLIEKIKIVQNETEARNEAISTKALKPETILDNLSIVMKLEFRQPSISDSRSLFRIGIEIPRKMTLDNREIPNRVGLRISQNGLTSIFVTLLKFVENEETKEFRRTRPFVGSTCLSTLPRFKPLRNLTGKESKMKELKDRLETLESQMKEGIRRRIRFLWRWAVTSVIVDIRRRKCRHFGGQFGQSLEKRRKDRKEYGNLIDKFDDLMMSVEKSKAERIQETLRLEWMKQARRVLSHPSASPGPSCKATLRELEVVEKAERKMLKEAQKKQKKAEPQKLTKEEEAELKAFEKREEERKKEKEKSRISELNESDFKHLKMSFNELKRLAEIETDYSTREILLFRVMNAVEKRMEKAALAQTEVTPSQERWIVSTDHQSSDNGLKKQIEDKTGCDSKFWKAFDFSISVDDVEVVICGGRDPRRSDSSSSPLLSVRAVNTDLSLAFRPYRNGFDFRLAADDARLMDVSGSSTNKFVEMIWKEGREGRRTDGEERSEEKIVVVDVHFLQPDTPFRVIADVVIAPVALCLPPPPLISTLHMLLDGALFTSLESADPPLSTPNPSASPLSLSLSAHNYHTSPTHSVSLGKHVLHQRMTDSLLSLLSSMMWANEEFLLGRGMHQISVRTSPSKVFVPIDSSCADSALVLLSFDEFRVTAEYSQIPLDISKSESSQPTPSEGGGKRMVHLRPVVEAESETSDEMETRRDGRLVEEFFDRFDIEIKNVELSLVWMAKWKTSISSSQHSCEATLPDTDQPIDADIPLLANQCWFLPPAMLPFITMSTRPPLPIIKPFDGSVSIFSSIDPSQTRVPETAVFLNVSPLHMSITEGVITELLTLATSTISQFLSNHAILTATLNESQSLTTYFTQHFSCLPAVPFAQVKFLIATLELEPFRLVNQKNEKIPIVTFNGRIAETEIVIGSGGRRKEGGKKETRKSSLLLRISDVDFALVKQMYSSTFGVWIGSMVGTALDSESKQIPILCGPPDTQVANLSPRTFEAGFFGDSLVSSQNETEPSGSSLAVFEGNWTTLSHSTSAPPWLPSFFQKRTQQASSSIAGVRGSVGVEWMKPCSEKGKPEKMRIGAYLSPTRVNVDRTVVLDLAKTLNTVLSAFLPRFISLIGPSPKSTVSSSIDPAPPKQPKDRRATRIHANLNAIEVAFCERDTADSLLSVNNTSCTVSLSPSSTRVVGEIGFVEFKALSVCHRGVNLLKMRRDVMKMRKLQLGIEPSILSSISIGSKPQSTTTALLSSSIIPPLLAQSHNTSRSSPALVADCSFLSDSQSKAKIAGTLGTIRGNLDGSFIGTVAGFVGTSGELLSLITLLVTTHSDTEAEVAEDVRDVKGEKKEPKGFVLPLIDLNVHGSGVDVDVWSDLTLPDTDQHFVKLRLSEMIVLSDKITLRDVEITQGRRNMGKQDTHHLINPFSLNVGISQTFEGDLARWKGSGDVSSVKVVLSQSSILEVCSWLSDLMSGFTFGFECMRIRNADRAAEIRDAFRFRRESNEQVGEAAHAESPERSTNKILSAILSNFSSSSNRLDEPVALKSLPSLERVASVLDFSFSLKEVAVVILSESKSPKPLLCLSINDTSLVTQLFPPTPTVHSSTSTSTAEEVRRRERPVAAALLSVSSIKLDLHSSSTTPASSSRSIHLSLPLFSLEALQTDMSTTMNCHLSGISLISQENTHITPIITTTTLHPTHIHTIPDQMKIPHQFSTHLLTSFVQTLSSTGYTPSTTPDFISLDFISSKHFGSMPTLSVHVAQLGLQIEPKMINSCSQIILSFLSESYSPQFLSALSTVASSIFSTSSSTAETKALLKSLQPPKPFEIPRFAAHLFVQGVTSDLILSPSNTLKVSLSRLDGSAAMNTAHIHADISLGSVSIVEDRMPMNLHSSISPHFKQRKQLYPVILGHFSNKTNSKTDRVLNVSFDFSISDQIEAGKETKKTEKLLNMKAKCETLQLVLLTRTMTQLVNLFQSFQSVISLFDGVSFMPTPSSSTKHRKDDVFARSEKVSLFSELVPTKLDFDVSISSPLVLIPKQSSSRQTLVLSLGSISASSKRGRSSSDKTKNPNQLTLLFSGLSLGVGVMKKETPKSPPNIPLSLSSITAFTSFLSALGVEKYSPLVEPVVLTMDLVLPPSWLSADIFSSIVSEWTPDFSNTSMLSNTPHGRMEERAKDQLIVKASLDAIRLSVDEGQLNWLAFAIQCNLDEGITLLETQNQTRLNSQQFQPQQTQLPPLGQSILETSLETPHVPAVPVPLNQSMSISLSSAIHSNDENESWMDLDASNDEMVQNSINSNTFTSKLQEKLRKNKTSGLSEEVIVGLHLSLKSVTLEVFQGHRPLLDISLPPSQQTDHTNRFSSLVTLSLQDLVAKSTIKADSAVSASFTLFDISIIDTRPRKEETVLLTNSFLPRLNFTFDPTSLGKSFYPSAQEANSAYARVRDIPSELFYTAHQTPTQPCLSVALSSHLLSGATVDFTLEQPRLIINDKFVSKLVSYVFTQVSLFQTIFGGSEEKPKEAKNEDTLDQIQFQSRLTPVLPSSTQTPFLSHLVSLSFHINSFQVSLLNDPTVPSSPSLVLPFSLRAGLLISPPITSSITQIIRTSNTINTDSILECMSLFERTRGMNEPNLHDSFAARDGTELGIRFHPLPLQRGGVGEISFSPLDGMNTSLPQQPPQPEMDKTRSSLLDTLFKEAGCVFCVSIDGLELFEESVRQTSAFDGVQLIPNRQIVSPTTLSLTASFSLCGSNMSFVSPTLIPHLTVPSLLPSSEHNLGFISLNNHPSILLSDITLISSQKLQISVQKKDVIWLTFIQDVIRQLTTTLKANEEQTLKDVSSLLSSKTYGSSLSSSQVTRKQIPQPSLPSVNSSVVIQKTSITDSLAQAKTSLISDKSGADQSTSQMPLYPSKSHLSTQRAHIRDMYEENRSPSLSLNSIQQFLMKVSFRFNQIEVNINGNSATSFDLPLVRLTVSDLHGELGLSANGQASFDELSRPPTIQKNDKATPQFLDNPLSLTRAVNQSHIYTPTVQFPGSHNTLQKLPQVKGSISLLGQIEAKIGIDVLNQQRFVTEPIVTPFPLAIGLLPHSRSGSIPQNVTHAFNLIDWNQAPLFDIGLISLSSLVPPFKPILDLQVKPVDKKSFFDFLNTTLLAHSSIVSFDEEILITIRPEYFETLNQTLTELLFTTVSLSSRHSLSLDSLQTAKSFFPTPNKSLTKQSSLDMLQSTKTKLTETRHHLTESLKEEDKPTTVSVVGKETKQKQKKEGTGQYIIRNETGIPLPFLCDHSLSSIEWKVTDSILFEGQPDSPASITLHPPPPDITHSSRDLQLDLKRYHILPPTKEAALPFFFSHSQFNRRVSYEPDSIHFFLPGYRPATLLLSNSLPVVTVTLFPEEEGKSTIHIRCQIYPHMTNRILIVSSHTFILNRTSIPLTLSLNTPHTPASSLTLKPHSRLCVPVTLMDSTLRVIPVHGHSKEGYGQIRTWETSSPLDLKTLRDDLELKSVSSHTPETQNPDMDQKVWMEFRLKCTHQPSEHCPQLFTHLSTTLSTKIDDLFSTHSDQPSTRESTNTLQDIFFSNTGMFELTIQAPFHLHNTLPFPIGYEMILKKPNAVSYPPPTELLTRGKPIHTGHDLTSFTFPYVFKPQRAYPLVSSFSVPRNVGDEVALSRNQSIWHSVIVWLAPGGDFHLFHFPTQQLPIIRVHTSQATWKSKISTQAAQPLSILPPTLQKNRSPSPAPVGPAPSDFLSELECDSDDENQSGFFVSSYRFENRQKRQELQPQLAAKVVSQQTPKMRLVLNFSRFSDTCIPSVTPPNTSLGTNDTPFVDQILTLKGMTFTLQSAQIGNQIQLRLMTPFWLLNFCPFDLDFTFQAPNKTSLSFNSTTLLQNLDYIIKNEGSLSLAAALGQSVISSDNPRTETDRIFPLPFSVVPQLKKREHLMWIRRVSNVASEFAEPLMIDRVGATEVVTLSLLEDPWKGKNQRKEQNVKVVTSIILAGIPFHHTKIVSISPLFTLRSLKKDFTFFVSEYGNDVPKTVSKSKGFLRDDVTQLQTNGTPITLTSSFPDSPLERENAVFVAVRSNSSSFQGDLVWSDKVVLSSSGTVRLVVPDSSLGGGNQSERVPLFVTIQIDEREDTHALEISFDCVKLRSTPLIYEQTAKTGKVRHVQHDASIIVRNETNSTITIKQNTFTTFGLMIPSQSSTPFALFGHHKKDTSFTFSTQNPIGKSFSPPPLKKSWFKSSTNSPPPTIMHISSPLIVLSPPITKDEWSVDGNLSMFSTFSTRSKKKPSDVNSAVVVSYSTEGSQRIITLRPKGQVIFKPSNTEQKTVGLSLYATLNLNHLSLSVFSNRGLRPTTSRNLVRPVEIFSVSLSQLVVNGAFSAQRQIIQGMLCNLQIDSHLRHSTNEVVLSGLHSSFFNSHPVNRIFTNHQQEDDDRTTPALPQPQPASSIKPLIQLKLDCDLLNTQSSKPFIHIHRGSVVFDGLVLNIDEEFVIRLGQFEKELQLVQTISNFLDLLSENNVSLGTFERGLSIDVADRSAVDLISAYRLSNVVKILKSPSLSSPSEHIVSSSSSLISINSFTTSSIPVVFSIKTADKSQSSEQSYLRFLFSLFGTVVSPTSKRLLIDGMEIPYVCDHLDRIGARLSQHYVRQIAQNGFSIIFPSASEITGGLKTVVEKVSTEGTMEGIKELGGQTAQFSLLTIDSITSTFIKLLDSLRIRSGVDNPSITNHSGQNTPNQINSVQSGVTQGFLSMGRYLMAGVSGLVMTPVRAVKDGGVSNMARGIGAGISEFFVLPINGVFQLVRSTTEGFLSVVQDQLPPQLRVRYSRCVDSSGAILDYQEAESRAYEFLLDTDQLNSSDDLVFSLPYNVNMTQNPSILIITRQFLVFAKSNTSDSGGLSRDTGKRSIPITSALTVRRDKRTVTISSSSDENKQQTVLECDSEKIACDVCNKINRVTSGLRSFISLRSLQTIPNVNEESTYF